MAPELIPSKTVLVSASNKELYRADRWSIGMTIHSICNPDLEYPFCIEAKSATVSLENLITRKYNHNTLPLNSQKYDTIRWKFWSELMMLYYTLCRFDPEDRQNLDNIYENQQKCQFYCLSVSQESSIMKYNEDVIQGKPTTFPEEENGLNTCTFLCLKYGQMMLNSDVKCDSSEELIKIAEHIIRY